jgi:hypothetical protein
MALPGTSPSLDDLRDAWRARWPDALAAWSRFTRLSEPRWCLTKAEEKAEQLSGSFAMIRLQDHAVVISLRQVRELHLEAFATEVLAHEIGHHVLTPGDLNDHARMIARMRRGLPSREASAGFVANLYTDLLINDRLQRGAGLRMADVYRALGSKDGSRLWAFYLRTYEILWSLPRGTLTPELGDAKIDFDAALAARLVRAYAKDWLRGSGRYAVLCLPYLLDEPQAGKSGTARIFRDTEHAGQGGDPTGLVEVDEDEEDIRHPVEDDELTGAGGLGTGDEGSDDDSVGDGARRRGSKRPRGRVYRDPIDYRELLRSTGAELSEQDAVCRYYREAATPHLVPFPEREHQRAADPQPEGLDVWDAGSPIDQVNWLESVLVSPHVVPGVTTVRRVYGTTEGHTPERRPVDLYLGIDCSGSMVNPAHQMSYPVLGGAIMALSALRAGARVMATLSGEPGKFVSTAGFVNDANAVMKILTGYLGTGYTFGIKRLGDAFANRPAADPPAHIVIITDWDIFVMLDGHDGGRSGWAIAADALKAARGGGTYLLHMSPSANQPNVMRMRGDGWDTYFLTQWEDVVAFAKEFTRKHYAAPGRLPT